jgi:hypothetical protein
MKTLNKFAIVIIIILTQQFIFSSAFAQTPKIFKYQAVLRDTGGNIITANTDITVRIYDAIDSNTPVWSETHGSVQPSSQGIINLQIGSLQILDIDWSNGEYFIGITINSDPEMGRSQLLAVPYALNAKYAETADYNGLYNLPLFFDGDYNSLLNKPTIFSGSYTDLTNKPALFSGSYADLTGTPTLFSGSYTDLTNKPALFSGSYTDLSNKPSLFSGSFADLTSKPTSISGYGILDAFDGNWSSLTGTVPNISIFTNNAGYLTGTWTGSSSITTLGTITTGTWTGSAIGASYIGNLPASQITSGTFGNSLINWAAPNAIGSTTANAGSFTTLSANNGLSVSAGTVNIKPAGSGGTNGYVLTTDGAGNSTWKAVPASTGMSVTTQNVNYSILPTDGLVITAGGFTFTMPSASAAGSGKIIYLYTTSSPFNIAPYSGNTIWDQTGVSHTSSYGSQYNGVFVSDGVSTWYQVAQ